MVDSYWVGPNHCHYLPDRVVSVVGPCRMKTYYTEVMSVTTIVIRCYDVGAVYAMVPTVTEKKSLVESR